jgi:hypothetical protein
MPGHRLEAFRRLYQIAERQRGLFTSKQAVSAGFSHSTHGHHVRAGNWLRAHRGIYRLALIPPTRDAELFLWELWSSDSLGMVQGVYSHQTALRLYWSPLRGPAKLHMTVPMRFRRNSRPPGVLTLHRADLADRDIVAKEGHRYTGPLRTFLDLAAAATMPRAHLREALLEMIQRGLITREGVKRARLPAGPRDQFGMLLRWMDSK